MAAMTAHTVMVNRILQELHKHGPLTIGRLKQRLGPMAYGDKTMVVWVSRWQPVLRWQRMSPALGDALEYLVLRAQIRVREADRRIELLEQQQQDRKEAS